MQLTAYYASLYELDGTKVEPRSSRHPMEHGRRHENGFLHFVMKEIHTSSRKIKKTILPRLTKGLPDLSDENIPDELLKRITNIRVIACGTAMHVEWWRGAD